MAAVSLALAVPLPDTLALDGAEEGGLGEDLPLLAAGAEQESVEGKAAGRQQGEHNGQNDQVFDHLFLFPAAVGLDRRPAGVVCAGAGAVSVV